MAAGATGTWAGFSDEELNRIRRQEQNGEREESAGLKSASLKRSRNKKRPANRISSNNINCQPKLNDADPNQLLAPPSQTQAQTSQQATRLKTNQVGLNLSSTSPVCLRINEEGRVLEILENNHDELNSMNEINMQSTCGDRELEKNVCDLSTLEKFEQRQKLMEEQNRQRRTLLTKALVERRKKTHEETVKLGHIQQELAKLDSLVSADVAILRKQIELSSVEFNESQKRYKKAEEEFVEAKLELFKRMEKKEQLTEHLCTIIEHNETRKAHKLAELMKELEMESLIEECENEGIGPMLSQLCALNDICYNSCSTIKDPNINRSLPTTPDAKTESQQSQCDNLMAGDSGCDMLNESTENETSTKMDATLSIQEKTSEC
uniref:RAB6-interacting golgin n=1 Tax=Strigamia maritima TaxID=126957 RepID=T1IR05_STRMM